MDVVRTNFLEILPKLQDDIRKCDFISIDTELSGLGQSGNSYFDTLDERYCKIKNSITNYLLIQYGLSCFTKLPDDDANGGYSCANYNFYVYPYKVTGATTSRDKSFLCSSSALTFLSGHNFDFNKWIREGISYMDNEEETNLIETLKGKSISLNATSTDLNTTGKSLNESGFQPLVNTTQIPDEHKEFIDKFMVGLNNFVNDDDRTKWNTDVCSSYRRKLIFQSVKSLNLTNLKLTSVQVTENMADRYISIDKISSEQKAKEEKAIIDEAVGFSRVIQELIDAKKPIVGHNLLLDMVHTVRHFIAPLPETLTEFKELLTELLPNTYDTKYISRADPKLENKFQNTGLNDLFNIVQKAPFQNMSIKINNKPEDDNLSNGAKTSFHNAGYDSYVTGIIFLKMVHHISPKNKPISYNNLPELSCYKGKYNLTFSFDYTHLDISKDQPESERFKIFHLTFPSLWTKAEILDLLSPFRPGQIGWINDTSALIALDDVSDPEDVDRVLSLLKGSSSVCKVQSYASFRKPQSIKDQPGKRKLSGDELEDGKGIDASTQLVKKQKSSNPVLTTYERTIFDKTDDW